MSATAWYCPILSAEEERRRKKAAWKRSWYERNRERYNAYMRAYYARRKRSEESKPHDIVVRG